MDTLVIDKDFYEFIESLYGQYKFGIISDDSSEWSRYLRNKFDISKYFDVITISGDVGIKKPDSRIFELTIDRVKCEPSECIYVDDRIENVQQAISLGMNGILFNTSSFESQRTVVNSFESLKTLISER